MIKETRLLLIGPLRVVGAEAAPQDGVVLGTHPDNHVDSILVAGNSDRGSFWSHHGPSLEPLAATIPCLFLSETRPGGLPFRSAWFSTPPETPGVLRRAMAGLDHLDFVLLQGEEAWQNLPVELPGTLTVVIGRQNFLLDRTGSTRVLIEWNPQAEELHEVQLLWLIPGQAPRVAAVDIAQMAPQSGREEAQALGVRPAAPQAGSTSAVPNGGNLLDTLQSRARTGLSPQALEVLDQALLGPLQPIRLPEVEP